MSQVRELIKKHLDLLKEERERWDLEKLLDITSKYNNLTDFLKNERKAADVLRRRGLYDELTSHMTRSNRSYTDDEIKDELIPLALEYYLGAIENDIIDDEDDDDSDISGGGGSDSDSDKKPKKAKKGKKD